MPRTPSPKGTGLKHPTGGHPMSKATYRGVSYDTERTQEATTAPTTLTYRGIEYPLLRAKAQMQREALRQEARMQLAKS